ncbi:MAG: DinB family protein [Actinomycetales bacterium]|nr:DinB family protein [Actinomycetales bacterium]
MIELSRGLRHLAWANDRFFASLAELPPEALRVTYAPDAWAVDRLAMHIVGSSEWYRYCLTGAGWTDLAPPTTSDDVQALRRYLAELDAVLIEQGALDDGPVTFEDERGLTTALRSTILTQACMHGTEHRAQIACALAAAGFEAPSLDDLDLWAFAAHERAGQAASAD